MQKIFDVNNKEDMDLLWSILPDFITSIYCKKESVTSITNWVQRDDGVAYPLNFISICWNDKTEIYPDKLKGEEIMKDAYINYSKINHCIGENPNEKALTQCSNNLSAHLRWSFTRGGRE